MLCAMIMLYGTCSTATLYMLGYKIPYHVTPNCMMSHHAMPCHAIHYINYITPHCITHIIVYYITVYHITLFYIM